MTSGDGRLLLCGRVIIQLNDTFDDIDNIGVIYIVRDIQNVSYKFLSLKDESDIRIITRSFKSKDMSLVYFDPESEPIHPPEQMNILYFT